MKSVSVFLLFVLCLFSLCQNSLAKTNRPSPFLEVINRPEEILAEESVISLIVHLPENHEYTANTPIHFEILREGEILKAGILKDPKKELPLNITLDQKYKSRSILEFDLEIPYCSMVNPKLCKLKIVKLTQPVSIASNGKSFLKLEAQIQ